MLIISYDFADNKVRSKFSRFIKKFGRRLQYSVYEIKNSPRVLQNIVDEVELVYKKQFKNTDSILIFRLCKGCCKKVKRYGYAVHEEEEVIFFN